jgi:hypothetical protein
VETMQWAIGILVVILTGIMGFFATQLWAHVVECRQLTAQIGLLLARLEGIAKDVERMKEDIGTHDTGMRGEIHHTSTMCTEYEFRLAELERRSP